MLLLRPEDQYKCGQCGGADYWLFDSADRKDIVSVCQQCKTKSTIKVVASLRLLADEETCSCMCTGWPKEKPE